MKKAITILLALLLCGAMILPALAESETVSIRLSEESLLIGTGVRVRLEVQTESTAKLKYTWETSDKKIASVANGNVTGEGEGEATVTCSALLNNEVVATASCAVSVYTSIRSLKAGADTTTLSVGQPVQVTAAITPENATYPQLVWTSSDESIATVDQNGVVTGLQPGRVKITCTSDQPNQAKAVSSGVQFTVKQQVTEIVLGKTQLVLWVKKSVEDGPEAETLRAEVLPENADSKKLIWESSDTAVAKVSNGKVSSVKSGVCTVTAKAGDGAGAEASCDVVVLEPSSFRVGRKLPEDAEIIGTEDPKKAAEIVRIIYEAMLKELTESERTGDAGILSYFAASAAAGDKVYYDFSESDKGYSVTVLFFDEAGTCFSISLVPSVNNIACSVIRPFEGELPAVQADTEVFGEVFPKAE